MNAVDVGLTILIYTTALVIIVVAGFLVKLIYDLSEFAKSAKSTSDLLQTELEPTLKELKDTMTSIKSIANTADDNFTGIKDAIAKIIDKSSVGKFMAGFLVGGAVGAVMGILFAPKSGEEMRNEIKEHAKENYSKAQEAVAELQSRADDVLEDMKEKGDEIIGKIQDMINKQKETAEMN